MEKNNKGRNLVVALAGIGILAVAVIIAIWRFGGNDQPKDTSRMTNQNQSEMKAPSAMNENLQLGSAKQEPKTKAVIPASLADAGEFSENIYDAARIDDWKTAESKLSDLKSAVKKLEGEKIDSGSLLTTLKSLGEAVSGKNKYGALEISNRFTLEAADLTAKFDPRVPVEVTKLDYYGREIEIRAGEKDETKLKQTTREMRKTWDAVRSRVEANKGEKEAALFEGLVKRAEAASSVADYAKLATPILDEVDNLENVFN
ncbi:MAG: hypothetical protein KDB79_11690 [Acidobacteria bacterium]|nr:hypothetical protein [Acidobacteriota bacterium]